MKHRLLFIPLLAAAILAAAQAVAPSIIEITAEPNHHLVLENQYVRVFKIELGSHAAFLTHYHRHDYIFVTLRPSYIENDVVGKPPVLRKFQDGEAHFVPGGFAHTARNLSDQPFHVVAVEFLRNDKAQQSHKGGVNGDEDRGLSILNGGTQDILFGKDGVRTTEVQLNPGGVVPKHHHAGPHLVIAVTDLDLRSDIEGKGASGLKLKAGEVAWMNSGLTHALTNTGQQNARLITLEFP